MTTEEIFDKEAEIRYPVKTHSTPNISPYIAAKITFLHGCRFGYQAANVDSEVKDALIYCFYGHLLNRFKGDEQKAEAEIELKFKDWQANKSK